MRASTLTKIKDFKTTAQSYGFEVTTSTPVEGGFLLEAVNAFSEFFELVWDAQGRFHYGPSYFGATRVRNLSDASRYLERFAPTHNKVVLQGTEKSIALYARKYDCSDDSRLGHGVKRLITDIPVKASYHKCELCGITNSATTMIALIMPQFSQNRNTGNMTYKGYNWVRFEKACDRCTEKHTAER